MPCFQWFTVPKGGEGYRKSVLRRDWLFPALLLCYLGQGMQTLNTISAMLLLLTVTAFSQTTRTWEQSSFEDFEKGSSRGVAIRSDGVLELAPSFRAVATTPSTYIWAVTSDKEGNLLAATGAPARVYRITPQGQLSTLLQPSELEVQAITVAPDGTIYAATSPDGKIYRIVPNVAVEGRKQEKARFKGKTPQQNSQAEAPVNSQSDSHRDVQAAAAALDPAYKASVFFEPHTKYIWALAMDAQGRLYIATGDRGEIYRVEANGSGSVFFKSDEAHIRSLAFDKAGNLIAGSDGSGLVYRISPGGQAFVLYSAPKKEITALAVDGQGNIFAAASGEKRANPTAPPPGAEAQAGAVAPVASFAQLPPPGVGSSGSEVYRIAPDGSPRRIWQSREDLVYALAFDAAGRLLAGTGNKGKIYALLAGEPRFIDLLQASANQVIGFAPAPRGGLWVATSNLGKLFLLEEAAEHEGTFDSDVFDAKIFSRWGHIEFRGAGNVELFARSGNVDNPDRNWSPWQKIELTQEAGLQAPSARYVQWRVVLHSGHPGPRVESVALNYLPKNVAPEVDEVTVLVGQRFPQTAHLIADVVSSGQAPVSSPNPQPPPQPVPDRNSIAVRWSAHDDNDDQLSYSVFYRGQGERRWQLLKAGLADRFYSFASDLLPDGRYAIRVVASDAPSHSPTDFLTGARASSAFDVDNTPPVIAGLTVRSDETGLHVTFRATDNYSIIRRAEFSIDAGEWQFIAPVGGISDARTENYDFTVPTPRDVNPESSGSAAVAQEAVEGASPSAAPDAESVERGNRGGEEHVVVVRVFDRADNVGTAKVVVHAGER